MKTFESLSDETKRAIYLFQIADAIIREEAMPEAKQLQKRYIDQLINRLQVYRKCLE